MVRAQAALEFLMTYGWAFLVMTAVVAGIVSLDPLGSGPNIDSCDTEGLESCDTSTALLDDEEDAVSIRVTNERERAVTYQDVSVRSVGSTMVNSSCSSPGVVKAGEEIRLLCSDVPLKTTDSTEVILEYNWYPSSVGPTYARISEIRLRGKPGETGLVTAGLVGYWPLEGNVLDATKYDNDGIIVGDPEYREGKQGEGLSFRKDDHVSIADSPVHRPTDSLTVSCWLRSRETQPHNRAPCVWKGDINGYGLSPRDNTVSVAMDGDYYFVQGASDSLTHGSWQHWVFTYNRTSPSSGQGKIYRNGELVDTNTGDLGASSQDMWFGRRQTHLQKTFNGTLDEIRIYNRTLSAAEVKTLYDFTK